MLSFRLSDEFINKYVERPVDWGYKDAGGNSLGEITFLRTYSRLKEDGTKERWWEVCRRVIEGMFSIQKEWCRTNRLPWNDNKAQKSAQEAYERLFTFKWTPPGRGLWVMGTPLVNEHRNSAALQNCAFVSTREMTKNDPSKPFRFLMEASMLGIGVGFDTEGAKKGLTVVGPRSTEEVFVIPDTREGWVETMAYVVDGYIKGTPVPRFDFSLVRPAGAPIKTFGGTAAGPEPLQRLVRRLTEVLEQRVGDPVDSRLIGDIGNLVGVCVVAGNVRRSAELFMGEITDKDFLNLKNPDQYWERNRYSQDPEVAGWGWMSNNSVTVNVGQDLTGIIEGISRNGEPGVLWMDVSRAYGRLDDPRNDRDYRAQGYNPCVTGDTLVAVADGRNAVPIKQLAEENYTGPVYTVNGTTVAVGAVSKVWKTRENAEIYELTLDDGSTVRATGDHRFMLRNGKYRPLQALTPGTSLMPFNSYVSNNCYRQICSNIGRDRRQYRMIADYYDLLNGMPEDSEIHHHDHDGGNDQLSNLIPMTGEAHRAYHAELRRGDGNPMRNPEVASRVVATLRVVMKGEGNGHFGKHHTTEAKETIGAKSKNNWERNHDAMCESIRVGMSGPDARARLSAGATSARIDVTCVRCERSARVYPSKLVDGNWTCTNCVKSLTNHKVVSVRRVGVEDVYDMTVPGTHNFGIITSMNDDRALTSSGIFIHNCAEQTLESMECCTLVETYLNRHESLDDYKRTLKYAYLYAKTVTLLPTHWAETNAIMQRNRRIGTSMSGIANFADRQGIPTLKRWMNDGYAVIQGYDVTYSEWLGVRESIKSTTVKPSGTVSILAGESPGVHWNPGGEFFERAIRFSKDDPMVELFRRAQYRVETAVQDPAHTVVVFFPVRSKARRSEKDVSIFEKVNLAALAQRHWSDNSVSVTVSFDNETEANHVGTVLHMYEGQLKTVSFLPQGNEVYPQMPYTTITEDDFENARVRVFPVDLTPIYDGNALDAVGEAYCTTDACELKTLVVQ